MKKVLLIFIVLLSFTSSCFADTVEIDFDKTMNIKYQKKVMEIGFKILNANRIEKRVIFNFEKSKTVNAYASPIDRSVTILGGIIPYFDDDNEIAAVLAHEIGHQIDYYGGGSLRILAMNFFPFNTRRYERKADLAGIDLMVKAGYNPVAMITAMNKFAGQDHWLWINPFMYGIFFADHPLTSKRLAYMYEYIYEKYPAYLVQNDYRENIYYQNFLLTSKKDREKIRQKHELNVSDKHSK
jgi:predicted Zn-dependent protease